MVFIVSEIYSRQWSHKNIMFRFREAFAEARQCVVSGVGISAAGEAGGCSGSQAEEVFAA
jgi:hypothetical protein